MVPAPWHSLQIIKPDNRSSWCVSLDVPATTQHTRAAMRHAGPPQATLHCVPSACAACLASAASRAPTDGTPPLSRAAATLAAACGAHFFFNCSSCAATAGSIAVCVATGCVEPQWSAPAHYHVSGGPMQRTQKILRCVASREVKLGRFTTTARTTCQWCGVVPYACSLTT